mmetsp:Transcript_4855/g.17337  ORF Transcript_4855/g.17337 Transcript_4855/m.17337 type:complete len:224 (+) Transcript_4855:1037-1708(+)
MRPSPSESKRANEARTTAAVTFSPKRWSNARRKASGESSRESFAHCEMTAKSSFGSRPAKSSETALRAASPLKTSSPPPAVEEYHFENSSNERTPSPFKSEVWKMWSVVAKAISSGVASAVPRTADDDANATRKTARRYRAISARSMCPSPLTSNTEKAARAFSSRPPPQSTDSPAASSAASTVPSPSASKSENARSSTGRSAVACWGKMAKKAFSKATAQRQ